MKLLYISHSSEIQGSGRALLNIIQEMIQKEIQVQVVIPKANGEFFEEINKLNIQYSVHSVVSWVWPRLKTFRDYILFPYRFVRLITKSLFFYNSLSKKVKLYQPDIIHTNVGVTHIPHFVAKRYNIPQVWHNREYQDLHFSWKPFPTLKSFYKKLHHYNNYPISITKGVYNHHNMELNENATIIYDGVFDGTIVNNIELNKSKYFLFVGSISEGKGTPEAVSAFISISKQFPDYELWIAGGGSKNIIDELKSKIINAGCSEKVRFLGYRTDIYKLMSKATALIVPSRFEGFGFITAEAMYNGCLVIGRNNAGTKEQFDNGLNFSGEEIGIRYNTTEELISIMQKLCDKGIEDYHKTIKLAQKTVLELYSTQRNANEIYNYYKKILNK